MKKTIFILFIALFIFKIFLTILAYRGSSSTELHNELLKYFTEEDIAKGEEYSRAGTGISLTASLIFSCMILIMSFTSLSARLEKFCAGLSRNRHFFTSLFYLAIAYSFLTLIMLPFNYYLSFISEHNFGFSNMTAGFWLWTRLKRFLLELLIISLAGSAALAAIKKFKFYSVFIVPSGGLVIGLVMLIIYPFAILPLFYSIKAIENPGLEKKISRMAQKSGIAVDEIYVIEESNYSNHTNAFFAGFGNHRKIYLYDTLVNSHSEEEVISILAHEAGHWVYNHNLKGIVYGFIISLTVFVLVFYCVKKMQSESGAAMPEMHSPSVIPLYLLLFIILSGITTPAEMVLSRHMEREADYYSLVMTGDPDAFIASEIRLAKGNRSRLNRHPLAAFFRSSHPAVIERINTAVNYKNTMLPRTE